MKNTWFKLNIEIESNNSNFYQTINIHDMINTDYSRLLDESIIDNYKKALKACGGKFDMLTISIKKSIGYTYHNETIQQYRFVGNKATPDNHSGIEGSKFYNGSFCDFQPCNKKEIVQTIKAYIAKVNSLYIEAIKENSQQLIAG
jgi:hypothetical protein